MRGTAARVLDEVASGVRGGPLADVRDDDGVRHRLWAVPDDATGGPLVATLREAACRGPLTIADGHHRYETALRYRDERRLGSTEQDPAFDYTLMLFMEASGESLTWLPTHRVARGLGPLADTLPAAARSLFEVEAADRPTIEQAFGAAGEARGGAGRIGLWDALRRGYPDGAARGLRAAPANRWRGAAAPGRDPARRRPRSHLRD